MRRVRQLFVSATRMEVQAVLDSPGLEETIFPWGALFESRQGDWACLVTGPGGFNAVAGLASFLAQSIPERVIDLGIAGLFPGTGLGIGDLALAENDTYAHTGVGADVPLPFDLIPGLAETRTGRYHMDDRGINQCRSHLIRSGFRPVLSGPFLTVSRITDTLDKALALASEGGYIMESMEGAALAHVCALYQVPMVQVRAASNMVGDRNKSFWDIPAACNTLERVFFCLSKSF